MDQAELAAFFSFVITAAAENNVRILGILVEDDYCVSELSMLLDLDAAAIAFSMDQLNELGLVSCAKREGIDYYHLELESLRRVVDALPGSEPAAKTNDRSRPSQLARREEISDEEAWQRKIRQTFFVGNRLAMIPDNEKSRAVVLSVVASQFEVGVRYPEKIFDMMLKNIYPDSGGLRRDLLARGLIQHERGNYWRPPPNGHTAG